MKSAAWLVALGLTLVAFSCDPELSLEEALNGNKSCSAGEPRCLPGYECDEINHVCVPMTGSAGAGPDPVDPPPRDAGGAGGSEAIGDGRDTMSSDVPDAADAAPNCTMQLFHDRDGDGYGSDAPGEQMTGCLQPGWVSQGGDCFDAELDAGNLAADVHPGQLMFFAEGYPRPNQPGEVSFDYDCLGGEEADPGNRFRTAAGDCSAATAPTNCSTLAGRVPTDRSGAGINSLCGSTAVVACNMMGAQCVPQVQDLAEAPFRCR